MSYEITHFDASVKAYRPAGCSKIEKVRHFLTNFKNMVNEIQKYGSKSAFEVRRSIHPNEALEFWNKWVIWQYLKFANDGTVEHRRFAKNTARIAEKLCFGTHDWHTSGSDAANP